MCHVQWLVTRYHVTLYSVKSTGTKCNPNRSICGRLSTVEELLSVTTTRTALGITTGTPERSTQVKKPVFELTYQVHYRRRMGSKGHGHGCYLSSVIRIIENNEDPEPDFRNLRCVTLTVWFSFRITFGYLSMTSISNKIDNLERYISVTVFMGGALLVHEVMRCYYLLLLQAAEEVSEKNKLIHIRIDMLSAIILKKYCFQMGRRTWFYPILGPYILLPGNTLYFMTVKKSPSDHPQIFVCL